ncbi:MAG TPA: universal stress protein, partial [Microthrixaceae bacterium]|nr:universal stress protein [Microthrixaceae bacterium]
GGTTSSGGTGGTGGTCVAETCDGADNDCDGTADNGDPGGGKSCTTNLPGVCAVGVTKCENGQIKCNPTVEPNANPESCNGMDDNCDGSIDENDPGGGGACMASAFGECKNGTQKCVNGTLKCQPGMATPEVVDAAWVGAKEEADASIDRTIAALPEGPAYERRVETGEPGLAIVAAAEEIGADVIVIGSRGRGAIKRALLGSVSSHVVHNASCPVVVTQTHDA